MLPDRTRRAIALAIPIVTAASLFGLTASVFKIGLTDNLASAGITLATVLGIANGYLVWLVAKHRVP